MLFHSNKTKTANRAFGLVELMVTISIMALVSALIVTHQSAFNGAVLLRNQAYEVAFTLREAQQLAVSGGEDVSTYGVFFDTTNDSHSYYLFRDDNNNNFFDTSEQIGKAGRLDSRFEIREVTPNEDGQLSIVFTRPNFDPKLCARKLGCTLPGHFTDATAEIEVSRTGITTDGKGDVRVIEVQETGEISLPSS